jgi:hypothetical protein
VSRLILEVVEKEGPLKYIISYLLEFGFAQSPPDLTTIYP